MKSPNKSSLSLKISVSFGLLMLLAASRAEIIVLLSTPRDWTTFLTPINFSTILIAIILLLAGIISLLYSTWVPATTKVAPMPGVKSSRAAWLILAISLLFVIWFLLFSPWQNIITGLWTRFLFLLSIASLIAITTEPKRGIPGWQEAVLAIVWLSYIGMVQEVRQATPLAIVYRGLTALGALLSAVTALLLYNRKYFESVLKRLTAWRDHLGESRWFYAFLLTVVPVLLLYVEGRENYAAFPFIRLSASLLALACLSVLVSNQKTRLTTPEGWMTAAGMLLIATQVSNRLTSVSAHPFSLTWSEGNRFYDYSLIFAKNLYDYPGILEIPYFAPGRYALWGSLFLIPGLPIWVHRLWNVFLLTIPVIIVAWLLARPLRGSRLYLPFLFWITLYLSQGPIQPPLLVSLLFFLPFLFTENLGIRAASLAITSLTAGLSRWTWAVGPGIWGAVVDLFLYYPRRTGSFWRRILPTVGLTLAGILPGMLSSWGIVWKRASSFALSQPLLWYRLWPNPTYPPGILLGILLATGPLVILLTWLAISRRWKMDILQAIAAGVAMTGFLGAGIVISVKIGGGADLHNLDLFFLTTALLTGLAAHALQQEKILTPSTWPRWAQVVLVFALLIPAWNAARIAEPPLIPSFADVTAPALQTLKAKIAAYQPKGEILFMDQRQLLTFGYIKSVPFIPEYEKKYMMDQAMAGNAAFFRSFYADLAARRFALIISDPLRISVKEQSFGFSEENNAWVKWVARPVLCYYDPLETFEELRLQILAPKDTSENCAEILPTNQE